MAAPRETAAMVSNSTSLASGQTDGLELALPSCRTRRKYPLYASRAIPDSVDERLKKASDERATGTEAER
jgi:hypothetical protein